MMLKTGRTKGDGSAFISTSSKVGMLRAATAQFPSFRHDWRNHAIRVASRFGRSVGKARGLLVALVGRGGECLTAHCCLPEAMVSLRHAVGYWSRSGCVSTE